MLVCTSCNCPDKLLKLALLAAAPACTVPSKFICSSCRLPNPALMLAPAAVVPPPLFFVASITIAIAPTPTPPIISQLGIPPLLLENTALSAIIKPYGPPNQPGIPDLIALPILSQMFLCAQSDKF